MKKINLMPLCRLRHEMGMLLLGSILSLWACSPGISMASSPTDAIPQPPRELSMRIRLHVEGQVAIATLYDNAMARDFAALLPLSLTLEDYAIVERISNLPQKLSTANVPAGMKPESGDIAYYAPWGNLVIFAGGNAYARGLLPLGKIDTGLSTLQRPGPLKVRIERIKD